MNLDKIIYALNMSRFLTNLKINYFVKVLNRRGFTLLELLISVTILILVSSVGIANISRLNERKALEGTTKVVEQAIRNTQKRASTKVKPTGFCLDPNTLTSYTINLGVADTTSYQIIANCSDSSTSTEVDEDLPQGIRFPLAKTITFDLFGEADNDDEVYLANLDETIIYQVDVSVGGSVGSDTANIFPTPTDVPPTIVLNSASGKTCTTMCNDLSLSCLSVGTSPPYDQSNVYIRLAGCYEIAASCGWSTFSFGGTCLGIQSTWTYCKCQ